MFDRPAVHPSAVLVSIDLGSAGYEEDLAEFKHLATGSGVTVRNVLEARRDRPDPPAVFRPRFFSPIPSHPFPRQGSNRRCLES